MRWLPITGITIEHAKFDTQKMVNPEISGGEYQKGTLAGYDAWEYLLEKFNHTCVYCTGKSGDPKLTQDHVIARANGGSNRISNLVVACHTCNQKKGKLSVETFLAGKPELLGGILSLLKKPLQSAAKMNSMRNALVREADSFGLPITLSTGAETKHNRALHGIPKSHALDAAFTGNVQSANNWNAPTLHIKAQGRGTHQQTRTDKYGFPRLYCPKIKTSHGFRTGDIVSSSKGTGRIAIRSTGYFSLKTKTNSVSVKHSQCRLVQKADGYSYTSNQESPIPPLPVGRGGIGTK